MTPTSPRGAPDTVEQYFVGTEVIVNDPGIINDQDIHNGQTTLREAIEYLNANPGLSVVRFDPAMNGQTIDFTDCGPGFGCPGGGTSPIGHVAVTTEMTIDAADLPDGVVVHVNRDLFWVAGTPYDGRFVFDFTLRGLTIEGSLTAGVMHSDTLGLVTLDDVRVRMPVEPGTLYPSVPHGVFSRGPITIIDSVIEGGGLGQMTDMVRSVGSVTSWQDLVLIRSEVRGGHGGVSATGSNRTGANPWLPSVTLIDSLVADTFGRPAIYSDGDVELVRSRVENGASGGIVANSLSVDAGPNLGGLLGGNVVLIDSAVTGNGRCPHNTSIPSTENLARGSPPTAMSHSSAAGSKTTTPAWTR